MPDTHATPNSYDSHENAYYLHRPTFPLQPYHSTLTSYTHYTSQHARPQRHHPLLPAQQCTHHDQNLSVTLTSNRSSGATHSTYTYSSQMALDSRMTNNIIRIIIAFFQVFIQFALVNMNLPLRTLNRLETLISISLRSPLTMDVRRSHIR